MQLYYFKDKKDRLFNPADHTTSKRNDKGRFRVKEKLNKERKNKKDQMHNKKPVIELLSLCLPNVINNSSESNLVFHV